MKKILIFAAAVLSMLFWSSTFVWFKVALKYYKPMTIVFLRLVIASVFLTALIHIFGKYEKIKKEDYKHFFLLAFFEPFCYFLGEAFGMQFVSSTAGSIIVSTIPLVTPFFAWVFLKEKITAYTFAGLVISFIGVILIVAKTAGEESSLLGILLMFFAVLSGTMYGIQLRKVSCKYGSFTIVRAQSVIGMLLFLPLFAIFERKEFLQTIPDAEIIFILIKLSVFASCFAFILFTYVIRDMGISRANIYTNLIPVFTAVIAKFELNEQINFNKIAGIIIVVSGLFVAQIPYFKKRKFRLQKL
ncbi:MAG: EamA family transporter [Candidatus Cloacimonadota bacterium]|nr:MAG: EamA family transporter [Candidatus Cloacimonadota bacterium]